MKTAALILALLAAGGPEDPPVDAYLGHALAVRSGEEMPLRISFYNRMDAPRPLPGPRSLRLEALSGEGGGPVALPKPAATTLERNEPVNLDLSVPLAKLVTANGSFRFVLVFGDREVAGRRFFVGETLDPPDAIRFELIPDREEAAIGEPVTVTFRMTNDDDEPFCFEEGGDYRGATRHLRHRFTAVREDGLEAVDPTPHQVCTGGLGLADPELAPGESYEKELPLLAYLRFPEPGVYRVTGRHAIGYGQAEEDPSGAPVEGGFVEGASFTIEILPAPPETRRAILESILAEESAYERRALASRLYDPAFLPELLTLLESTEDPENLRALVDGIGSIPDLEATTALVRLAAHPRPAVRREAIRELIPRLPNRPASPWGFPESDAEWDESQREPLRTALRAALLSPEPETIRFAAGAFVRLGADDAVPLLASAAERLAPDLPVPGPVSEVVDVLGQAAAVLGGPPVAAGAGCAPGRLAVWAMQANAHPELRRDDWSDRILALLRSPSPLLNAAALRGLPDDYGRRDEIPWRDLMTSTEMRVWWYALQAARADPPTDFPDLLRELLAESPEPHVKMELERALDELGE